MKTGDDRVSKRPAMKTMDIPAGTTVMEEGKPFFFEGEGAVGCLLIHGFTGTTSSMKPMGEYLAGKGLTVLGPRLPGHGTSVEDMARWGHRDWIDAVETALEELRSICSKVFVSGLSMGGLLTLYLAERHPDKVDGIVPINAPVSKLVAGVQSCALPLVPLLKRVIKAFPGPGNDLKDPETVEVAYPKLSTEALHELIRLADLVEADLASITAPVRIFVSRDDHVVPPENARIIRDSVSSSRKDTVWLFDSYHVATLDLDRERLFEKTWEFIRKAADLEA